MKLAFLLLWLCCSVPALAQPRIAQRMFTVTARENTTAGMVVDDYRNYLRARKDSRDRFVWHTWQIVTGPRAGGFTGGAFGRLWEDFDTEQISVTESLVYLFPTARVEDNAFFMNLAGLGRNPFWEESPPAKLMEARYYRVTPGKEATFEGMLATVRDHYAKARQPRNYAVYRLFNGGPQAVYLVWAPLEKFSDVVYPDRGVFAFVDSAISNPDFSGVIQSTFSELLRYRADLTYTPSV
jgi:hypothetical protein